ncbi:HK97 family phage portal protein [Clostridioides difficile]
MGIMNWLRNLSFGTPSIRVGQRNKSSPFSFCNDTLASNETIFAAITMLANSIASVPISLRNGYEKVKPSEHYIATMLRDGFNKNDTMFEFIRLMEVIRNTKGSAYAIKEYDYYDNISDIWVLDSDFVTPIIDTDTKEMWYRISTKAGDSYFHNSHIIAVNHIKEGSERGISPINVLKNTLNYDREVKELSLAQLSNNIDAKYAFKISGNFSKEKLTEYHEMIKNYMDKGIIYLDSGKSLEELKNKSFIDPKIFEVEEITVSRVARVFTMPAHKLYAGKQSYSSSEQADLEYLVDTILPIIRMYEQEFNKKCLTTLDRNKYEIKFNLSGFARADMKTRGEFYQKMVRCGGLTPNEIRELEDRPPKQDGDDLMVSRDLIKIKDLHLLLSNKNNLKGGD